MRRAILIVSAGGVIARSESDAHEHLSDSVLAADGICNCGSPPHGLDRCTANAGSHTGTLRRSTEHSDGRNWLLSLNDAADRETSARALVLASVFVCNAS